MSSDKQKISKILSKQLSWIQTWKTKNGGYNGYVVHRYDLKRMFKIHDTPWTQGPIINGYLNLYQTTKNNKWLHEAIQAADLQCKRITKKGKYIYAGFEDDRFSSLVHNSLANCSLLDLAKVLIDEGNHEKAAEYITIVKRNIDGYLIDVLWDENFGAFKFSEIDYYTPHVTRYVVNMNSVAVESLIKLSNLIDDKRYLKYALKVGNWMLAEQIKSSDLENGGINYSQVQPRFLISIYTALAMRGLDDLYGLTNDDSYLKMIENSANHLINLIDASTKCYYHAVLEGKLIKYPQFIAGAGIILKALNDAEKLTGKHFNYEDSLNSLLNYQLDNGGFSNFIGYRYEYSKIHEVWEDKVPVMGWNAHLFEFLTRLVDHDFEHNCTDLQTVNYVNRNYIYRESKYTVFILGIRPIKSCILYFAVKNLNFALLNASVRQIEKLLVPVLPLSLKNVLKKLMGI